MSQNSNSANPNPQLYTAVRPVSPPGTTQTPQIHQSKPEHGKPLFEFWNKHWLYELGACLLSLLFFIAIVVVLKKFEHQRLRDLGPDGITINTVISILATGLGATLSVPLSEGLGQLKWLWFRRPRTIVDIETFDSATRGPVGAFQLLYKLKGLHLGTLGSFITIVALALSPFIQQVITYKTQETVVSFAATIPRSNQFALYGSGDHFNPEVNLKTQAAVFSGIYNSDESALQVKANCNTGNCSFSEPYSSLAVCSMCSNITSFIEKSIFESITDRNETFNYYNYSLPNGLSINDMNGAYINTTASNLGIDTVWSGFGAPISVMTVISSTNDAMNDPQWGLMIDGPWAAQCVLYFCINTYISTVENGTLTEQTISTFFNESATLYGTDSGPNGTDGYSLTQDPCVTSLESGDSTYSYFDNEPQNATFSTCIYFVENEVFFSLANWLPSIFSPGEFFNFPTVLYNNVNGNGLYGGGTSNFTFVDNLMSRLALSLTTNIRTYGLGNPAFGTSSTQETYIKVQWNWLILPAIIVFFSIFFFLAIFFQSIGMDPWKSSSLPLLFSSDVTDEQDGIVKLAELEWIAKGRCAVLKKTAEGNVQLTREID